MNELIIQGKKYISSKHAAELTGYAKDYIGQLCREGYVEATMVGRSWYVLETSIMAHRFGKDDGDNMKATVATSAAQLETTQETVESTKDKPADTWVPAI